MASKYKSPPEMRDGLLYADWKKELNIWKAVTDLEAKKQGGALFLTLSGKARETVLAEVSLADMSADDGVTAITNALDNLFDRNSTESAFASFDNFIKFKRPSSMSVKDYIIDFNLRKKRVESHKLTLPDGIVAYYLLDCANLPKDQAALCRATCSNLTYKDMKTQIERVTVRPNESSNMPDHGDRIVPQYVAQSQFDTQNVQYPQNSHVESPDYTEPVYQSDFLHEDFPPTTMSGADDSLEGTETFYTRPGSRAYVPPHRARFRQDQLYTRKNPSDQSGQPSACRYCKSIFHWVDECPELSKPQPARGFSRARSYSNQRHRGYGRGYSGKGSAGEFRPQF